MLVTVRHNLEVTNTTKPYTIDIFSVNKTIIPPSNATTILTNAVNKSTTTLTNALNNKTNVILNAAKSLLNKSTTTKLPVDSGRPTVPTNTKDPPLSRKASNIDNKTGGKTTVTPKKTATSSIKTGIKPEMTLSQASIPFNWTIQTNDFGQFTYFMIVLIGVIVSRFYQRFQNGGRDMTTEDFLWAGIAAIIALLVFSTFQQQVSLTKHIITNISLAFGFGFGFDRVLQTVKPSGPDKNHKSSESSKLSS